MTTLYMRFLWLLGSPTAKHLIRKQKEISELRRDLVYHKKLLEANKETFRGIQEYIRRECDIWG